MYILYYTTILPFLYSFYLSLSTSSPLLLPLPYGLSMKNACKSIPQRDSFKKALNFFVHKMKKHLQKNMLKLLLIQKSFLPLQKIRQRMSRLSEAIFMANCTPVEWTKYAKQLEGGSSAYYLFNISRSHAKSLRQLNKTTQ